MDVIFKIMIKDDEIMEIGKFFKTHGLKGELNAELDVEEDFAETGDPLIVEMEGIFVPFFPEFIRTKGASFLVKLQDVDSADEAQKFVNKKIYARRSDLVNYFGAEEFEEEVSVIGMNVIDETLGELGKIVDFNDSTANELLIVERPDGSELYIPFNEDFITEVDEQHKTIRMDLPEGLVDLNVKEDE